MTAAGSGQVGGKEIFCCSVWILTVVILREGSSGSRLSCWTGFGRKQTGFSSLRKVGLAYLLGDSLYLQFWDLGRLEEGLLWDGVHSWRVQAGWCGRACLGLHATGAVQKGPDRCEVQVHAVGVRLAWSICGRGCFLRVHLQRKRESGGFQHDLHTLPQSSWAGAFPWGGLLLNWS